MGSNTKKKNMKKISVLEGGEGETPKAGKSTEWGKKKQSKCKSPVWAGQEPRSTKVKSWDIFVQKEAEYQIYDKSKIQTGWQQEHQVMININFNKNAKHFETVHLRRNLQMHNT